MKRKILSMLMALVIVIGLLPTTAFAAASTIYVGGKALNPGEYITGDGVISTTKPEDNYAYLQSDENEDYILTLHNFDHTGEGAPGNENISGLINFSSTGENLRLVLEGTSTLTKKTGSTKFPVYGIYFRRVNSGPKLTISGSGTLNINTDTGIHIGNSASFEMESGTINIKANRYGYQDDGYSKTIKINGNLNIESGNNAFSIRYSTGAGSSTLEFLGGSHSIISDSCAFYVLGNVIVKGGSLVAKSKGTNPVADSSTSISAGDGIEILASTNVDGTGAAAYKAADKSTYKYLKFEAAPAPTPEIWVGGKGMVSGQYLDESGNVGTTALSDNYAYYEEGVLTLKNYDYSGAGSNDAAIYRSGDLTIELYGTSDVECTDGIGIDVQNGALTVSGAETGSRLKAFGNGLSGHGIRAFENIIFTDADVEVTSASGSGIVNSYDTLDDTKGYVTVSECTLKVTADIHGIYTRNGYSIDDSNVEVNAGSYGLYVMGGNTDSATTDSTLKVAGERGGININYRVSFENSNAVIKCTSTDDIYDANYFAITPNNSLVVDEDLTVLASADPAGSNPETYDAAKNSTYDWIKISGASVPEPEPDPAPTPTPTIKVKKVDEAGQPLAGAQFKMYISGLDVEYLSTVTEANGLATFTDVADGDYMIEEVDAPDGYQMSAEAKTLNIVNGVAYITGEGHDGTEVYDNADPFVFVNEQYTATFYVTKIDDQQQPLAGAKFKLENTVAGRDGYTATSDAEGKVTFPDVVDGEYILSETAAPAGYNKSDVVMYFKVENGEVKYSSDRNSYVAYGDTLSIVNTEIPTARFSVAKIDEYEGALGGAVFHLTEEGKSEPAYVATSDAETGMVSFTGVVDGTYILSEATAPAGYVKTGKTWKFLVNTAEEDPHSVVKILDEESYIGYEGLLTIKNEPIPPVTAPIVVKKTDNESNALPGAKFILESDENEYEATSDGDGLVTFPNVAPGYYTLAETEVPDGYLATEWTYNFTVYESGAVFFFDGTPGSNGDPYSNEEPVVIENEKIQPMTVDIAVVKEWDDGEGENRPESIEVYLTANDAEVPDTRMTLDEGNDWTHTWEGRPAKDNDDIPIVYSVGEVDVPNYTSSVGEPFETDTGIEIAITNTYVEPDPVTATIVIKKTDTERNPLANAQFMLESDENEYEETSGGDGLVTFEDVKAGSYVLREIVAPNGYAVSDTVWHFTVSANGVWFNDPALDTNGAPYDSDELILEFVNEPVSFTVAKVDKETEEPLPGATFQLKEVEAPEWAQEPEEIVPMPSALDENIRTVVSDEDGSLTFSGMTDGWYELTELSAPAGYVTSEETWLFLVENGEVSLVENNDPIFYDNDLTIENDRLLTIQIPVTKAVTKGGNKNFSSNDGVPFEFEVKVLDSGLNTKAMTVTGNTVTVTSMAGASTTIVITVPAEESEHLYSEGIMITEESGEAEGWTYDETAWIAVYDGQSWKFAPYNDVYGEGVTEPVYQQSVTFTNTYTKNASSGGGGGSSTPSKPVLNKEDHFAFLTGYPDGSFGPDRSMTRGEVATMFANLLTEKMEPGVVYENTFTDVPAELWCANYIGFIQQFGLVSGYEDGSFRPDAPITRAEFATIACRFEELTEGNSFFPDVPDSFWAAKFINFAATRGWVSGYEDGTFKPDKHITRAEVVTVTCQLLERIPDKDFIKEHLNEMKNFLDIDQHWAYWNILEATNGHDYTKKNNKETWSGLHK